jgi:hypothetical protein
LLARRLAEAGCGFIQMFLLSHHKTGYHEGLADNWDDHSEPVRGNIFQAMRRRLPVLDQTVSALIEDIYARGLDRKIMVVVTGEFGRTPRISTRSGLPGREHWGDSMSVLLSGGGLRTGQVIGATNRYAEHPTDRPVQFQEIFATLYTKAGLSLNTREFDLRGRPQYLVDPDVEPIRELV